MPSLPAMLATAEIIEEAAQVTQLAARMQEWRALPVYRHWANTIPSTRIESPEPVAALRDLPFLDKQQVRAGFPANFLGEAATLQHLLADEMIELEYTSGTSLERLPVIFGRHWWNDQEERALRLNRKVAEWLDQHPGARRATLTAPTCNGLTCPTAWQSPAQRTLGSTLFVNLARIPFLLSEAELERMVQEIAAWSPLFLDLDPVHGARFAHYCEQHGIRFPSLRFVLGSYEFVSVVHRRIIERAFGVPLFNLYGSTETGHLLMEDEGGVMRPSLKTAYLEIVEPDEAGIGHLVVTTLSNNFMPLVRYRIGDLAEQLVHPHATRYFVHGRTRDALQSRAGQRISTAQIDQCFARLQGILHYELRQVSDGQVSLRYVPEGDGPTVAEWRGVTEALQELLESAVPIPIKPMPTLLPQASGKFRLTHPAA